MHTPPKRGKYNYSIYIYSHCAIVHIYILITLRIRTTCSAIASIHAHYNIHTTYANIYFKHWCTRDDLYYLSFME